MFTVGAGFPKVSIYCAPRPGIYPRIYILHTSHTRRRCLELSKSSADTTCSSRWPCVNYNATTEPSLHMTCLGSQESYTQER